MGASQRTTSKKRVENQHRSFGCFAGVMAAGSRLLLGEGVVELHRGSRGAPVRRGPTQEEGWAAQTKGGVTGASQAVWWDTRLCISRRRVWGRCLPPPAARRRRPCQTS